MRRARTVLVDVVFGWSSEGPRVGQQRVVIPEEWNEVTTRSRVYKGKLALHGPDSRGSAAEGSGFWWLERYGHGWIPVERADIVPSE